MARNKGNLVKDKRTHGTGKLRKDVWLSVINKGRGTQSQAEET